MAEPKTKRIAVSPTEEALILEYRQKTAEDRAFNHALTCVLDLCIPHELSPGQADAMTKQSMDALLQRIRGSVENLRKPV